MMEAFRDSANKSGNCPGTLAAHLVSGVMPSLDPANPAPRPFPEQPHRDWRTLPYRSPQEKAWAIACSQYEIEEIARGYGLDLFPQRFVMVDYDQMNQIAARGGFPTRYPHWRFGMEYESLSRSYAYGLSKIYEMVINNDPCWAYLLDCNGLTDQQIVIAHVCGHNDFFKNNRWFAHANRKMLDAMGDHAAVVWRHIEKQGVEKVEKFIDICLSIEDLIDPFSSRKGSLLKSPSSHEDDEEQPAARRFHARTDYMDRFINPPEVLEAEEKRLREERDKRERRRPAEPERDVLFFLLEHAPLKAWQKDILNIIGDESYYFRPQGQTKIMNEGWASFWHFRIMTRHILIKDERGLIDFADHHSGTLYVKPGGFNPYKLGYELFCDIEDRWNRGCFGEEWEQCQDREKRRTWDKKLGLGLQKIFEVRRDYNDVMFLDEFLTPEFCARQKMFTFSEDEEGNRTIISREFTNIKTQLLNAFTNMGRPVIRVLDADYNNRAELAMQHQHEGQDLKVAYAAEVLRNIHQLWTKPVHVLTTYKGKTSRMSFDGNKFEVKEL